jgi:threonine aldolase
MTTMPDEGIRVDLYSDTKTRPSPAMLRAMAVAPCGDEQQGEDPTVAELNAEVASLLGKPSAIFLPSGTMANLIAVLVHCSRGDELIAERSSHVFHFETGGPAAIAGVTSYAVDGVNGIFSRDDAAVAIRPRRWNSPHSRLLWIEQTTNLGGGAVWPLTTLNELRTLADERGLLIHIDGARLLNAATAHNVDPAAYGAIGDSLWIDFTKGLGAPFGAVLAGSQEFTSKARRFKHMLGGAMRQAGPMAGACLFALRNNVGRLRDDHLNARGLYEGLKDLSWLRFQNEPETNILVAEIDVATVTAEQLSESLAHAGIRISIFGERTIRMVTHLDVGSEEIASTIAAFRSI